MTYTRYTKAKDLQPSDDQRYQEEIERVKIAKLHRIGFFAELLSGFTYCGGCLCGGGLHETPDRRLSNGRTKFGSYRCTNTQCRYHHPPNSGWFRWTDEEKAVWAVLSLAPIQPYFTPKNLK